MPEEMTAVAESAPAETPAEKPDLSNAETISAPGLETEPAKETETVSETVKPVAETKPSEPQYTERERQFQAEKDRAEAYVKNMYKQILPYFEVDDLGNIKGLKPGVSPQAATQKVNQMEDLIDKALMTGDKQALQSVLDNVKREAVNEARQVVTQETAQQKAINDEVASIKKDYPQLYKEDGSVNDQDPLFLEVAKITAKRQEFAHPLNIRMAIEMAEGKLLKQNMPKIEQQIKNSAQTKLKQAVGTSSAISTNGKTVEDASDLDTDQIQALKKEGYDDAGIAKLSKIVKQAKKEGGFYL